MYLCVIFLILCFIVQFTFGIGKSITADVVALVIYLLVCVAYVVFLLAVKEIVISIGDSTFIYRMRDFLYATVLASIILAPSVAPILLPDSMELILGLTSIVLLAIIGIVSIRIAPFFDRLDDNRAKYGKKVSKWLKISGWLMATVILSPIGAILSLVADYHMWRLVRQERLHIESK